MTRVSHHPGPFLNRAAFDRRTSYGQNKANFDQGIGGMTQAAFSDLPAFGHFRIDIREGVVYRYGTVVRLRRKAFDVLTVLYQHINEFVEYEQIGQLGWKVPSVEKHNIQTTMQEVRRALGAMDGARIENVP